MYYQIQMHFLKNVHFVKALLLFVIMIKIRKRKSMINSNKKQHFLFSDFICIQCSNKYIRTMFQTGLQRALLRIISFISYGTSSIWGRRAENSASESIAMCIFGKRRRYFFFAHPSKSTVLLNSDGSGTQKSGFFQKCMEEKWV